MKKYEKFPFNHFMLWCRGWYNWGEKLSRYEEAQRAFELDGYLPNNDAYKLSIIALEEICKYLNSPLKLSEFIDTIERYCRIKDGKELVILAVYNYLRFIDLKNVEHKLVIAKEGLKGLKHNSDKETINRVFGEERDEPELFND